MEFILGKIKYRNSLLLLLLFLILQLSFSLVVKDLYIFQKIKYSVLRLSFDFSILKFCLSLFIVFSFIVGLTLVRIKGLLYSILILILIFFVFPSAIFFASTNDIDYRIFLSHCLLFSIILFIGKIKIKITSKTIDIDSAEKILFVIILIGMIPFFILYIPHVNLKNLLLQEIYETRAIMTAAVNNMYTNYTYAWFNKILIPCLVVFGIYFKKRGVIVFSILSLVFLFLCGAHKAVFAGIIMVLLLYKYDYIKKMNYFIKFMLVVSVISLLFSVVFQNDFLTILTIRRTIFLPSLLDILYFDFFDNNFIYWSQTFNGLFINYPYDYPHYYVIGDEYFHSIKWAANNGIISGGFMNFGMLGVIINSVIIGFYFSILNQLEISSKFFGIFFLLFFVIISSTLPTIMLTHGGIVLLLLAFMFLKKTDKKMT